MRSTNLASVYLGAVWLSIAASGAAQAPAPSVPAADAQEIETSLFLIGDAGHADRPDHPVLSALREAGSSSAARSSSSFSVTTLSTGLPEKDAPAAPRRKSG